MRKDVKLGMAIGGGLIVLLVGYLLLAPPSNNNKKGTQLANGNIIDPSGPGDLAGNEDKPGSSKVGPEQPIPVTSNGADTRPTVGNGAKPDVPSKPADKPKSTGDQWGTALNKGKTPGPVAQADPKETVALPKATRHENTEGRGTPTSADPPKLLYNPNDAWGGGVSTDAVFGTGHSGKTDLAANPTASKSAAEGVTGGGGTHVVKSGETLSSIALSAYGSTAYYPHILRANPGINPNNLKLGTPLKLPHISEVKADSAGEHEAVHSAAPAALEVKIDPSKQYRVEAGDSLYKISMKVYGKSTYLDKIYEKNKALIGADNKRLKLGMILELPEKSPTAAAAPSDPTTSSLSDPATEENQAK